MRDPRSKEFSAKGKRLLLDNGVDIVPPYLDLQQLIVRRPDGLKKLAALQNAVTTSASGTPDSLQKLASISGSFFANTSLDVAANPMFGFWFVLARLTRIGAVPLQNAKGLATLRVRTSSAAALSPAVQWTLTAGVGVPAAQLRPQFPF